MRGREGSGITVPGLDTSMPHTSFRRMTRDDLPMAHRWLETPEVRRWWSDPDGEVPLDAEDLDDPHIRMWIVSRADRAFASLQDYSPHGWPMHHSAIFRPAHAASTSSSVMPT